MRKIPHSPKFGRDLPQLGPFHHKIYSGEVSKPKLRSLCTQSEKKAILTQLLSFIYGYGDIVGGSYGLEARAAGTTGPYPLP